MPHGGATIECTDREEDLPEVSERAAHSVEAGRSSCKRP